MGWNELEITARDHPLLSQFAGQSAHAYFVHSYQLVTENDDDVLARVEYGGAITAAVGRDNMIGTQFHPEKSQATGLALIEAFLRWAP
jgi:glutamine amidotransferase